MNITGWTPEDHAKKALICAHCGTFENLTTVADIGNNQIAFCGHCHHELTSGLSDLAVPAPTSPRPETSNPITRIANTEWQPDYPCANCGHVNHSGNPGGVCDFVAKNAANPCGCPEYKLPEVA